MWKNYNTYVFCSVLVTVKDRILEYVDLCSERVQTFFQYYSSTIMSTKLTKSIPYIFQNIFREKTYYF